MAAVQPRTRSLRLNIAAGNPRPKATAATILNHENEEERKNPPPPAAAAPLSVFLTNLRLLDLDLLPDWPGITIDTFATTGVQGQKKRIQCVEWVLVKLFGIWEPEETCSKLLPFFPPQDQMQSVNLRAALMRALDVVKKNGFLGRDSVLRKTMLNDCKGERLEEVLASFSTAVLKKLVQDDLGAARQYVPVAVNLALENRGYDADNTDLHTLNLSYRDSLRRFLARKEKKRAMYRDFGDLLGIKERSVARRMEAICVREADSSQDTLSENAREEMRQLVRSNWSGNEKWMETLISGGGHAEETGLLGMPFDRVWRRVQQGRLAEIEQDSSGLLEQLDSRVRIQKDRLAKWDAFRKSLFCQPSAEASCSPSKKREAEKKPNRGIDFQFLLHHDLQVGSTSRSLGASQWAEKTSKVSQSYEKLLAGLNDELACIKNTSQAALNFLSQGEPRRGSLGASLGGQSTDGGGEAVSEMSELEEEPDEAVTAALPAGNRTKLASLRRHFVKPKISASEVFNQSLSSQSSSSPSPRNEDRTLRKEDFFIPPPADELEELEPLPSPARESADDILEAMSQASPSPVKRPKQRPTLSLAQRTRLSMAGNQSLFLGEEPDLPLRPLVSQNDAYPAPPRETDAASGDSNVMDLASRTRLSMAGFEQTQKKAQLERRKSLRKSKMLPIKEGGYSSKADEEDGLGRREALTQELIMEEDMEAVFKSRPKMRTSPVGSPTKEW